MDHVEENSEETSREVDIENTTNSSSSQIKDGIAEDGNAKTQPPQKPVVGTRTNLKQGYIAKQTRKSLHFTIIRDALYEALGNKERAEIKLCDIQKGFDMSDKTFYRHLKTLRNTEFEINRMMYGTELKRRKK